MRIGVCGLGFMGSMHLRAYQAMTGVEVAGVCGGRNERSGNFGQSDPELSLDRMQVYPDWRAMVGDSSIHALDICLPSDLHAEVTEAALQNGKHVLCEKPLALTEADCDRVLRVAAESGRVLMVGHVLRFWPEYMYLQEWARSGQCGAVVSATFIRRSGVPQWSSWLTNETRSGGAVVDMLVHDVDQILQLCGAPRKVTAKSIGGVDSIAASFLYEDRAREVRLQGGWFAPGAPLHMSFQVRAERGLLEMAADGLWLTDLTGKRDRIVLPETDAFAAELAYFVDCCQRGARPEQCLPEESANAVKLALRVKESRAKEGEQILC